MAQYYNFVRLGIEGYRRVQQYSPRRGAGPRARGRRSSGPFELITRGEDLPVFAFKVRDDDHATSTCSTSPTPLRERGWQVPAYTFPANREDLAVLRVVVKRGFTHDVAGLFIDDLRRQLPRLEKQPVPVKDKDSSTGFTH